MQPSPGPFTSLLKKILFRHSTRNPRLQRLWGRLHTLTIFGMNYGGGGAIESSGELHVLSHVIKDALGTIDSPVVFDVGANIGEYSLQVRRHVPRAMIYAFEPAKKTYQQLVQRLDQTESIKLYNFGFSDSEKTAELYSYSVEGQEASPLSSIDPRRPTQVLNVQAQSSESIQVVTIDRFCEREGIDQIHFLKLDVEGHELAVLHGAERMLDGGRISIIQFEFGPANIYSRTYFYDFWQLLSSAYDVYRIIPSGIVPIQYYGEHLEIFLTTNYLAIRKSDH
jgi:FkbM family methyltransferase